MNYETPHYTKALKQLGWQQFENHPIYFRKIRQDRYEICFNVDWRGQDKIYNDLVENKQITIDQLSQLLVRGFEAVCAKTICNTFTYDILLILTADFYYHSMNKELHEKYKNEYEQLTDKKY